MAIKTTDACLDTLDKLDDNIRELEHVLLGVVTLSAEQETLDAILQRVQDTNVNISELKELLQALQDPLPEPAKGIPVYGNIQLS